MEPTTKIVDLRTAMAELKRAGYADVYGMIGEMTNGHPKSVSTARKIRTMVRLSNNSYRITTHN